MKPQEQVVTASDVHSCLYYVHADRVDDDKLGETGKDEVYERNNNEDRRTSVPPLPNRLRGEPIQQSLYTSVENCTNLPAKTHAQLWTTTYHSRTSVQFRRKPVGGRTRNTESDTSSTLLAGSRRPLGPRPIHSNSHLEDNAPLETNAKRQNMDSMRWFGQLGTKHTPPPSRAERSDRSSTYPEDHLASINAKRTPNGHRGDRPEATSASFHYARSDSQVRNQSTSLTLIRRYYGEQWNVGKIRIGTETNEVGRKRSDASDSRVLFDQDYGTISIEIVTPGYDKFFKQRFLDRQNQSTDTNGKLDSSVSNNCSNFERRLWPLELRNRPDRHWRLESDPSRLVKYKSKLKFSASKTNSKQEKAMWAVSENMPPLDKPIQGCAFQSPWNGVCNFIPGTTGRSLKCRHTRDALESTAATKPQSSLVSELRFNLPSSTRQGKPASNSPHLSNFDNHSPRDSLRHTSQHPLPSGSRSPQEHDDDSSSVDGRMDLSLGREHAGGGSRGKQAKLGKLIVANEGLKMLDLLVAANVGLWWQVYDGYS